MDISDRSLFQNIVTLAATESRRPLTESLGLCRSHLERLITRHLPGHRPLLWAVPAEAGAGADALEEPDLRAYLLECRAGRGEEESWLAAIVARRSLRPNHLWQDLGMATRDDLNTLFRRHFPELVRRNRADMKWKKFFYRQLCEREGIPICKAPTCAACSDTAICFGPETGEPLHVLASLAAGAASPRHRAGRQ
jgi:nitrogen fixation protein NifQ